MNKILLVSSMLLFLIPTVSAETMFVTTYDETRSYDLLTISYIDFSNISVDEFEEVFSKIPIRLMQNYPNPFKPQNNYTTIKFELKKTGLTEVSIYNLKGQKIITLLKDNLNTGNHFTTWDGKDKNSKDVSNGVYFYSVLQNENLLTKKMIIIR